MKCYFCIHIEYDNYTGLSKHNSRHISKFMYAFLQVGQSSKGNFMDCMGCHVVASMK